MGNKLGRRQLVDDKYTRPQGLYQHKDVDHKKLRKLILDSKLSPCYPGLEEIGCDLEECPICFLYYPSLNRSRCCTKGICTECFLQMKTPNSSRPTQCPFCKTSNYAVEYRGVKTKEEKGLEQIEEQRVIEAKIRMRQQEIQHEEELMLKRRDMGSASIRNAPTEVEYCSTSATPSFASAVEGEELVTSQESRAVAAIRQPPHPRQIRDDGFDVDLEDIMVMEAVWLSIQENDRNQNTEYGESTPSEHYIAENRRVSAAMAPVAGTSSSSSSPSGGLACAIAALAERQQSGGESSSNYGENISSYSTYNPRYSRFTNREDRETGIYPHAGSSIEVSPDSHLTMTRNRREWGDHRSDVAEVGTSYGGTEEMDDSVSSVPVMQEEIPGSFQPPTSPIVPESFEEQMMLAMAVSLAEAQARTSAPGVAWH